MGMSLPLISVISCAHNEEAYMNKFFPNLLNALRNLPYEIILVADRCTDDTVKRARKYPVKIIEKKWGAWESSYSESLQMGLFYVKGSYVGIIDVDIIVPTNFFKDLLPLLQGNVASVAAHIVTYPNTFWNRVISAWEKTYNLAPLGREPFGAARIILKKALDEIHGFRDVLTPDTDVDIRLAKKGYRSVVASTVRVYHARRISLKSMVRGQIRIGRGRQMIGMSFMRTMAHAIFRLRPFVIGGWLLEWQRSLCRRRK